MLANSKISLLLVLIIGITNIEGGPFASRKRRDASNVIQPTNVFIKAANPYGCGENEVYKTCGSACPPTCVNSFYNREDTICTKQCVSDCFCKDNYYRAKDGHCVPAEKCCQGAHEQFSECGSACHETCDHQPTICPLYCVRGCFCKDTYIRQNNSTHSPCIKRFQCALKLSS